MHTRVKPLRVGRAGEQFHIVAEVHEPTTELPNIDALAAAVCLAPVGQQGDAHTLLTYPARRASGEIQAREAPWTAQIVCRKEPEPFWTCVQTIVLRASGRKACASPDYHSRRGPSRSASACGPAGRGLWREAWHHKHEGPRETQPTEPAEPNGLDTDRAHLARRRFITMQNMLIAGRGWVGCINDQHPVPRDPPADQHRHRPIRAGRIQDICEPVTATTPHPPPVADPAITRAEGESTRHAHRRGP